MPRWVLALILANELRGILVVLWVLHETRILH